MSIKPRKKDAVIEGKSAYWYAKITKYDMEEYKKLSKRISEMIKKGDNVLEVGSGPGYTLIELAKIGKYSITGMDLSSALVAIAEKNAQEAGTHIKFCQGNASKMPFDNKAFDFILNKAAFTNFLDPIGALNEMHRVLKNNGKVLIEDLKPDASFKAINEYVNNTHMNFINSMIEKAILFGLRRTAYSKEDLIQFISQTKFKKYRILEDSSLDYEVWLYK